MLNLLLWISSFVILFSIFLEIPSSYAVQTGVPNLLDFEDNTPAAVYDQYSGIIFINGELSNHPIQKVISPNPTISPTHVLELPMIPDSSPACEFNNCESFQLMNFSVPQYRVSLTTGLIGTISPTNSDGYKVLLKGYMVNTGGEPVQIAASETPCLGNTFVQINHQPPINTPLEIDDGQARITLVKISLVQCNANPNYQAASGTIAVDNLLYDRPLNPPPQEHDPPIIINTYPKNGWSVTGSTPGLTSIVFQVYVQETHVYSMTAQVNGHTPISMGFNRLTPDAFEGSALLDEHSGLIDGLNQVTITVLDFDSPQMSTTYTMEFNFKTPPIPPPSTLDVIPTAVEATQVIDFGPTPLTMNDYKNNLIGFETSLGWYGIPLVQGKDTLIRLYGAVSGTTSNVPGVYSILYLHKANCHINCYSTHLLPQSGYNIDDTSGITLFPVGTQSSNPLALVTDLSNSWNFLIPSYLAYGDWDAYVEINSGYYDLPISSNLVQKKECITPVIDGTCDTNNLVVIHMHFTPSTTVTVSPVMVHLTGTFRGTTFNDLQPTLDDRNSVFALLKKYYPLDVEPGRLLDITVDPGIDQDSLLDRIKGMGFADWWSHGTGSNFYLGILPSNAPHFASNYEDDNKCCRIGYATVGGYAAWATSGGNSPAHEIGHDMGFDHWDCLDGTPDDECGSYPYYHGKIDGFGTDITEWRVIPPILSDGNHVHDLMVAIDFSMNTWISAYDYDIIFNHPYSGSFDADDPPAMMFSGMIFSNGTAKLNPLYEINTTRSLQSNMTEDDTDEMYTIRGYDNLENTIYVKNFEPTKIDDHFGNYGKILSINEVIPILPNLQRLVLTKGSQILGGLNDENSSDSIDINISKPEPNTIWKQGTMNDIEWSSKSSAGLPLFSEIEYSPDGGKTRYQLANNMADSNLTVNSDGLPGGTNATIIVQVSDGFKSSIVKSSPFIVDFKPPEVQIMQPINNSKIIQGSLVGFVGFAIDHQGILDSNKLVWSSSLDGKLGVGKNFTTSSLSLGNHTVTLSVTNSNGQTTTSIIYLEIIPSNMTQLVQNTSSGMKVELLSNEKEFVPDQETKFWLHITAEDDRPIYKMPYDFVLISNGTKMLSEHSDYTIYPHNYTFTKNDLGNVTVRAENLNNTSSNAEFTIVVTPEFPIPIIVFGIIMTGLIILFRLGNKKEYFRIH